MGEFSAEGGGVHPGKPIIWPTGKSSSTPVSSSQQTQTPGSVRNVPSQTAPAEASAPATAAPSAGAPAKPAPTVARPLTVEDIRTHLLQQQIEPTDFNTKLASLMLRNGVEVSRSNFVRVMTMLQGTNQSQPMQEAALMLLMKGIDSPQAVKVLGQYFSENPALASQFAALKQGAGNLINTLSSGKALLDPNLLSQLTAILAQLDETFQTVSEKSLSGGKKLFNQANTINDVRALKALLQGVGQKSAAKGGAEAQALTQAMGELGGKLDGILQNLVAQAILSQSGRQEVNYHYQQIPNAMTTPEKNFEIVIQREGEGKGSPIDPHNTQIVMTLETQNMGKIVISMIVKDKKVYIIFVFNAKEYGEDGRSLIAREYGGFQEKLANQNFQITGYQVKVDPAMCNIKPYLIPLLPQLESILKRIDLEA
ncbi:MAG: hypothetical protein MUC35_06380 [Candidatus Margulisbacteria bacterium]|jgi:hypothetical protein|nr:hypothetical protein [Candidatus Margulisiibacteriota bacterium]